MRIKSDQCYLNSELPTAFNKLYTNNNKYTILYLTGGLIMYVKRLMIIILSNDSH